MCVCMCVCKCLWVFVHLCVYALKCVCVCVCVKMCVGVFLRSISAQKLHDLSLRISWCPGGGLCFCCLRGTDLCVHNCVFVDQTMLFVFAAHVCAFAWGCVQQCRPLSSSEASVWMFTEILGPFCNLRPGRVMSPSPGTLSVSTRSSRSASKLGGFAIIPLSKLQFIWELTSQLAWSWRPN